MHSYHLPDALCQTAQATQPTTPTGAQQNIFAEVKRGYSNLIRLYDLYDSYELLKSQKNTFNLNHENLSNGQNKITISPFLNPNLNRTVALHQNTELLALENNLSQIIKDIESELENFSNYSAKLHPLSQGLNLNPSGQSEELIITLVFKITILHLEIKRYHLPENTNAASNTNTAIITIVQNLKNVAEAEFKNLMGEIQNLQNSDKSLDFLKELSLNQLLECIKIKYNHILQGLDKPVNRSKPSASNANIYSNEQPMPLIPPMPLMQSLLQSPSPSRLSRSCFFKNISPVEQPTTITQSTALPLAPHFNQDFAAAALEQNYAEAAPARSESSVMKPPLTFSTNNFDNERPRKRTRLPKSIQPACLPAGQRDALNIIKQFLIDPSQSISGIVNEKKKSPEGINSNLTTESVRDFLKRIFMTFFKCENDEECHEKIFDTEIACIFNKIDEDISEPVRLISFGDMKECFEKIEKLFLGKKDNYLKGGNIQVASLACVLDPFLSKLESKRLLTADEVVIIKNKQREKISTKKPKTKVPDEHKKIMIAAILGSDSQETLSNISAICNQNNSDKTFEYTSKYYRKLLGDTIQKYINMANKNALTLKQTYQKIAEEYNTAVPQVEESLWRLSDVWQRYVRAKKIILCKKY